MSNAYISRADAAAIGKTLYYTGKLCRNRHRAMRRVSDGKCEKCEKAKLLRKPRAAGVSGARAEAMRLAQNNRCAICNGAFKTTPHVDHCHETGTVRALLCRRCNLMIGLAGDSVPILRKAASYVYQHKVNYFEANGAKRKASQAPCD